MKELELSKVEHGILGALVNHQGCEFRVWAPHAKQVRIDLLGKNTHAAHELLMERADEGHFVAQASARPGDRYFYKVDQHQPVPDPVSRLLPEGVHGPTEIIDPENFIWSDAGWRGVPLSDYVIYELHIGTFTRWGTFEAAIEKLDYLKKLGISVIEIMPVAAFPGTRNWGYDGVSPYAVQESYGGPDGLRRLVDAAHSLGLGVILDVVYNHLGNEGNYLRLFGPYFTAKHKTPWGEAINYDQRGSEEVRRYFIQNARYWIREYHLDGLRLDAVQTIYDQSSPHILAEITQEVNELAQESGRQVCVIAETDENDEKMVRPRSAGGYGLDAVWSDDFHHAVHAFFTGERKGYYQDFGRPEQIVRALNEGFVFQGEPFRFWQGRPRGTSSGVMPAPTHVICIQNHDQVGNRAQGERLTVLIPRGARLLAAASLLLAPQTPLLFMGQEFDESNPFQFFTDYGDPGLQKAVSEGRRNEFKDFEFKDVPDPQDPRTFERSKLDWSRAIGSSGHWVPSSAQARFEDRLGSSEAANASELPMLDWYSALLALRKKYVLSLDRTCKAELHGAILTMDIPGQEPKLKVVARLEGNESLPDPGPGWQQILAADADGIAVKVFVSL